MKKTAKYLSRKIAKEISQLAYYYDSFIQISPLSNDDLQVYHSVRNHNKIITEKIETKIQNINDRSAIFYNGNFNYGLDIQNELMEIYEKLNGSSRVFAVLYSPYLKPLYQIANFLRIKEIKIPSTFVTENDLKNLCRISGYELIGLRPCAYIPIDIPLISRFFNFILPLVPLIQKLPVASLAIIRPLKTKEIKRSISIIIPARNEKNNIERCITGIPKFSTNNVEIIFVEGNSSDGTWDEIERQKNIYQHLMPIKLYKQPGKGKCDAVRNGIEKSNNDLIMILDADLTMPPEELVRFYEAYQAGYGEFINGSRLVYPMESGAMRPLNFLGNKFFAKMLSYLLDEYISDSLCGTKVFSRSDYARMVKWRHEFGDFDPFGDFELIFPASILGMKIIDIPIKYRDRVYGETQISRFRHGLMLLKMALIGLLRIKAGKNV